MESHTFGDPQPVKDTTINSPTWKIDVLRRDIVVGTLYVNHKNLPPRKNKKKVLWKLPSSIDNTPKFGVHEKIRLWELFKAQKKERRKTLKQQQSGDLSDGGGETAPTSNTNGDHPPEDGDEEEDDEEEVALNIVANGSKKLTIDEIANSPKTNGNKKEYSPPGLGMAAPPRPSPGLSDYNPVSMMTPPGLVSFEQPPEQRSLPTTPPLPPPGFGDTPGELLSTSTQSYQSSFDIRHNQANVVVETFLQQVCQTANLEAWLNYYTEDATKSLLVGSAQAISNTHVDRKEQWEKLMPNFQVSGYTSIQNSSATNSVLVVLTGTTRQQLGAFSFTMTLLLVPVSNHSDCTSYQIQNDVMTLCALPQG